MAERILIVEDDQPQRGMFVRALAKAGYTVVQAANAAEAMRKILEQTPNAVVLDLVLPDAHGVEVAGAIRAVAGSTRMPIIVVTGHVDKAADLDPARFSAECVLTKPVTDDELTATVRHCLQTTPTNVHHDG